MKSTYLLNYSCGIFIGNPERCNSSLELFSGKNSIAILISTSEESLHLVPLVI